MSQSRSTNKQRRSNSHLLVIWTTLSSNQPVIDTIARKKRVGIQRSDLWILAGLLLGLTLGADQARAQTKACAMLALPFDGAVNPLSHASFSKLKRDTQYTLMAEDGRQVVLAQAEDSASLFGTTLTAYHPARWWPLRS